MYTYYVVKRGDTLSTIASRYNTTVTELRVINNLSANKTLKPGEVITVPVRVPKKQDDLESIPIDNNELFTQYVVKRGDNLYTIAKGYNISAEDLMLLNGIESSTMLQPGQILIVPRPHIHLFLTKTGDSLQNILDEKKINASNLINYNRHIYLLPNQLLIYRDNNMY